MQQFLCNLRSKLLLFLTTRTLQEALATSFLLSFAELKSLHVHVSMQTHQNAQVHTDLGRKPPTIPSPRHNTASPSRLFFTCSFLEKEKGMILHFILQLLASFFKKLNQYRAFSHFYEITFLSTGRLTGSQFLDQGLNPGHGSESSESQPEGHQELLPKAFLTSALQKQRGLVDSSAHLERFHLPLTGRAGTSITVTSTVLPRNSPQDGNWQLKCSMNIVRLLT